MPLPTDRCDSRGRREAASLLRALLSGAVSEGEFEEASHAVEYGLGWRHWERPGWPFADEAEYERARAC